MAMLGWSENREVSELNVHINQAVHRPLNLSGQFTVRATYFHSEIGLSHSEICVLLSHDTRFRGTKHNLCSLVTKMYQLVNI